MILNCLHHGINEFFEDKNLVFRGGRFGGRAGGRGSVGGRGVEGSAEASAETGRSAEQAPQDPFEALQKLRRDIDRRQNVESQHAGYHRRPNEHTRDDLDEVVVQNPETRAIVERQLELQGLMNIEQIETMERTHDAISSHYMNPAFMLYMDSLNNDPELSSQIVYGAMNTILQHPYDFDYNYNATDKTVSIRKKVGSTLENVSLVMVIGDGTNRDLLSEVNGKSLKVEGRYPWEGIDYQSRMQDYKERFDYEWSQGVYPAFYAGPWRTIQDTATRNLAYSQMQMEAFKKVTPEMQELYLHNNVTIPLRFIQLVKARNFDFELNDPGFQALLENQPHLTGLNALPKTEAYSRITQNRDIDLKLLVVTHPDIPDAYLIGMRDHPDQTLVIHKNGMLLYEDASGNWLPHPNYGVQLRRGYYTANAGRNAETLIEGEAFRTRLAAAGVEATKVTELMENRRYMAPVEIALASATWEQIKQLGILVGGEEQRAALEHYFRQWEPHRNNAVTMAPVIEAIRGPILQAMPESRQLIDQVAGILGVQLGAPTVPAS